MSQITLSRSGRSSLSKMFAILCSITLVLALVPVTAFADDPPQGGGQPPQQTTANIQINKSGNAGGGTVTLFENNVNKGSGGQNFTVGDNVSVKLEVAAAEGFHIQGKVQLFKQESGTRTLLQEATVSNNVAVVEFTSAAGTSYELDCAFEGDNNTPPQGGGNEGSNFSRVGVHNGSSKYDEAYKQGFATIAYKVGEEAEKDLSGGTPDGDAYRIPMGATVTITKASAMEGKLCFVDLDGQQTQVTGNTYTFTATQHVDITFDDGTTPPGGGGGNEPDPEHLTHPIKVTVDKVSEPLLAGSNQKFVMTAGYGDDDDITFSQNGAVVNVSDAVVTNEKLILSFAGLNNLFFESVVINGTTYGTFDTGMKDGDGNVIVGVELRGQAALADEFDINLTIGAKARVEQNAATLGEVKAEYAVTSSDGLVAMSSTNDFPEVVLTVNDTDNDSAVSEADATFDLGVTLDDQPTAVTGTPLNISMDLNTSVYTADDYVVVRNHEGEITELDTTYDANTGTISFSSSQYSKYSIVQKSKLTKSSSTTKTTLSNTGDEMPIVLVLVSGIMAAAIACYVIRRKACE